jgi:hypothetical protein
MKNNPDKIIFQFDGNGNTINIINENKKEPSFWENIFDLITKIKKLFR